MRRVSLLLTIILLASLSYANNLQFGAITKVDATHLQFTIQ